MTNEQKILQSVTGNINACVSAPECTDIKQKSTQEALKAATSSVDACVSAPECTDVKK